MFGEHLPVGRPLPHDLYKFGVPLDLGLDAPPAMVHAHRNPRWQVVIAFDALKALQQRCLRFQQNLMAFVQQFDPFLRGQAADKSERDVYAACRATSSGKFRVPQV